MPKPGQHVTACVEVPELGEPRRGDGHQEIIGMRKIVGPAVVDRENADGTIEVTIYNNIPDSTNNSSAICGGSALKPASSPSDRGPGRWWVE